MHHFLNLRFGSARLAVSSLCLTTLLAGCGGGASPEPVASNDAAVRPSRRTSTGGAGDSAADTRTSGAPSRRTSTGGAGDSAADTRTSGASSRPAIDGIPLDVYFDNPLEVAADDRAIGAGAVVAANTGNAAAPAASPNMPADPPPASTTAPPAAGTPAWDDLISAELIESEVKSIRNELSTRLSNFGAYGRSVLEVPVFAGTLAFVANIADQHKGDIGWKPKAKVVRTLATKMAELADSAEQKNRNTYDEINNAFMMVCSLLDKNDPAEQPEPDDSADLATIAPMGHLMKRIERGSQWLQTNTGTEDNLKSSADIAKREVAIISAIGQAFASEDYGYGDDEEFINHTYEMRDAASGMLKTIQDGPFADYDLGRSTISRKCTECHSVYRNG